MLTLAFFLLAFQWPPAPPRAVVSDCTVNDSKVEGQPLTWLVRIKLRAPDGTEKAYVIAHRDANERKKALMDCNAAMVHYEQLAKREDKK